MAQNIPQESWALVTGASSGIGRELARALAADGHPVLLVARREAALRELAADIARAGGRAEIVVADLSRAADVEAVAARGLELGVDILCNNAGVGQYGAFLDRDVADTLAMLHLNVDAVVALTRRIVPSMIARGRGRVLNVASTAAFSPIPYFASYSASKTFVLHFTESLDEELRGTGVRAHVLCPGPTRTEFDEHAGSAELSAKLPGATAGEVARKAMRMLRSRRRTIGVVGVINWLLAQSARFMPRRWVRRLNARIARPALAAGVRS